MDSQLSSSFHLAHVFLRPLFSHAFRLLPDLHPASIHHGRRASVFAVQFVQLPRELASADGVAGARLRAQAEARSHATGQLGARGFHLLLGVRPGRAGATGVVILPHATGVLRALAVAPFPQLHHIGGDLRPPLRDVRGGAAVSAPVPSLLRNEGSEPAPTAHRRLLLCAPDAGPLPVHCPCLLGQVGALERRLGSDAGGCSRPTRDSGRRADA
jgi:hypothetical protein